MEYWVNKNEYEAAFQKGRILLLIVYDKCCCKNMFAIKKFVPYWDFKMNKLRNILHKMNENYSIKFNRIQTKLWSIKLLFGIMEFMNIFF